MDLPDKDKIRNIFITACNELIEAGVEFKIEEHGRFGGSAQFTLFCDTLPPEPEEDA